MSRECTLRKNSMGLYDLAVQDDDGTKIINNITLHRAAAMIEDLMYTTEKEVRA